jgi:hypothetical protein
VWDNICIHIDAPIFLQNMIIEDVGLLDPFLCTTYEFLYMSRKLGNIGIRPKPYGPIGHQGSPGSSMCFYKRRGRRIADPLHMQDLRNHKLSHTLWRSRRKTYKFDVIHLDRSTGTLRL